MRCIKTTNEPPSGMQSRRRVSTLHYLLVHVVMKRLLAAHEEACMTSSA